MGGREVEEIVMMKIIYRVVVYVFLDMFDLVLFC